MSLTVCLAADTLGCPNSGGHMWAYLNWALGLRSLGCRVIWLERVGVRMSPEKAETNVTALKHRLERYDLSEDLALYWVKDNRLEVEADLLLDMQYSLPPEVVGRFRRSALLDIDPGLFQFWLRDGGMKVAPHDVYFTIGETVGQPDSKVPDAGRHWLYTPPCIALDWWPATPAAPGAPFTTVSNWHGGEWATDDGGSYCNNKRSGFLPVLGLPGHTLQPLELALCAWEEWDQDNGEWDSLQKLGWRLVDAQKVADTPWNYQGYIQRSRGEFSCAKPSCVRLQNAWVSDRTLCYLASGRPAVVQHTGLSRVLPDAAGLFRFRTLEEAVRCLETVADDYPRQSRLARALAEDCFDARRVVAILLERALA